LLSTDEAARLLGVGATAVKRWADQGLLTCLRTPGGHRRFARAAVERFLRQGGPGGAASWVDFLVATVDSHAVEARLLEERARLGTWSRVASVLGEALVELGRRWETGVLTIAEEHLATERLARALVRVSSTLPLDPGAPRALLAMAEGDDHTLGLALTELCLREAGWSTLWAGRATPTGEAAALARSGAVQLVAVSASCNSTDDLGLRRQVRVLADACRAGGASLALGGAGAWPDEAEGAVRFRSVEPFSRWARELAGRSRPSSA
jgi:excisionase family DNA binding protein